MTISGVYEIRNTLNGKRYIGSAVNVGVRLYEHRRLLRHTRHHSIALQRAWEKYGEEAFDFRLLCQCEPILLRSEEQKWMNALSHEYNMAPVAGSQLGIKRTAEQRAQQSIRQKGNPFWIDHCARNSEKVAAANLGAKRPLEWRLNIAAGLRGKKHTAERVALQIGNKRGAVPRSAETRKRMSEAAIKRERNRREKLISIPAAGHAGEQLKELAHG